MLSLLAAAFDQGLAYVREGYRIYLMAPPYDQKREAGPADVERALRSQGFHAELLPFGDWDSLIAFVREKGAPEDTSARAPGAAAEGDECPGALRESFPLASKRYGGALMPLVKTMRQRGYLLASGE